MTREQILSVIRAHLATSSRSTPVDRRDDALPEDLDADSLDLYTLVQELEDSYGVRISDEEAARILTVDRRWSLWSRVGSTTASEVPGDD